MEENIDDKTIKKMEESIKGLLNSGLTTGNIDNLLKLSKIKHMAKEDKEMNYGNYNRESYNNTYGNYNGSYNRRGYDMRYRGENELDRIGNEYSRYQESRQRYGASEETDKSYHYMIKALEDFIKVLYEEADNEKQKQMLRETLQRSM